jgi:hypothetical protein
MLKKRRKGLSEGKGLSEEKKRLSEEKKRLSTGWLMMSWTGS